MGDHSTRRIYNCTHVGRYGPVSYEILARNDLHQPCLLSAAESHCRIGFQCPEPLEQYTYCLFYKAMTRFAIHGLSVHYPYRKCTTQDK